MVAIAYSDVQTAHSYGEDLDYSIGLLDAAHHNGQFNRDYIYNVISLKDLIKEEWLIENCHPYHEDDRFFWLVRLYLKTLSVNQISQNSTQNGDLIIISTPQMKISFLIKSNLLIIKNTPLNFYKTHLIREEAIRKPKSTVVLA